MGGTGSLSSSADAADVARVLGGDRNAFEGIVRRHGAAAIRLASQWVGEDEAPDVAQEAFVRAFRYLRAYDPSRPFRPWLLRIVANAARQAAARQARGARGEGLRLDVPEPAAGTARREPADPAPGPEAIAEQRETLADLRRALASLPADERAVLLLRYRESLTYGELAETLGWPLSLVRNRLARARRRVALALRDEAGAAAGARGTAETVPCPGRAVPEQEVLG